MATKMRIFSSLALTAATLFVVPLSSEEALARGGMGGGGGMRSFGVVRTSPVIVSRVRTTNTTVLHKQTSTSTLSRRKLTTTANVGTKNTIKSVSRSRKLLGTQTSKLKTTQDGGEPSGGGSGGGKGGTTGGTGGTNNPNPGGGANNPNPGGGTTGGTGGGTTTGGTGGTNNPNPGGGANNPNPGGGTTTGGTGGGTTTGGTGGGTTTGGTGTGGTTTGSTGHKPPVIIVEHPVYTPAPVTVAPVAVDPPGCVYERSVRKLPGGGLQRVIVKVCPE